jgi:glyoxylate reductase
MGKVVVTARLPGRWREILAGHQIVDPGDAAELSRDQILRELGDADALLPLLSVRVDAALLAAAPRLSIVANYAVGYDNLDVAACSARRIAATNTPEVLTDATADLAMALILAAGRRFVEGDRLARSGDWHGWEPDQLHGLDLAGATLGIIGLGRIGRAVAKRAEAFGMKIVSSRNLDEMLPICDVVSIHCPLKPETHHLIGARELALMKPTAVLVNTARGPIVDENALAQALRDGRPGFAGLDVFENEPRIHPDLVGNPRVVLLPHLGSATRGTRAKMAEIAAENIRDCLAGRRPRHLLNPEIIDS